MKKLFLLLFVVLSSCIVRAQSDTIGVYYRDASGLHKMNAIKSDGQKTNAIGAAFSMGIANINSRATFRGVQSKNIVNKDTEFFFYFPRTGVDMSVVGNQSAQILMSSDSPEDFGIAEFIVKKRKKNRELVMSSLNAFVGSNSVGVRISEDIQLKSEQIKEGVYKVTLVGDIPVGEYCFISISAGSHAALLPVFDFSVRD